MTEEGIIEIVPLGYMRGRTFKNAWIIADEMQNSSPTQMVMLATRIGEGSKMIITGDLNQSDRSSSDNGLKQIYEKVVRLENRKGPLDYVRYIEFEIMDVQRSRAAKAILDIYSDTDSSKSVVKLSQNVHNSSDLTVIGSSKMNMHNPRNDDAALIPLTHISKYEQKHQRPY
jgi:phosphate starvation-inducible protein PhoH